MLRSSPLTRKKKNRKNHNNLVFDTEGAQASDCRRWQTSLKNKKQKKSSSKVDYTAIKDSRGGKNPGERSAARLHPGETEDEAGSDVTSKRRTLGRDYRTKRNFGPEVMHRKLRPGGGTWWWRASRWAGRSVCGHPGALHRGQVTVGPPWTGSRVKVVVGGPGSSCRERWVSH